MNDLNFNNFVENPIEDGGRRKQDNSSDSKTQPLLSIITVVYNNDRYIEETLKSLYSQKFENYEHIIVDGGSTDETLKIIKKYENKIDYWASKKDRGIYDAFNIGMSLAKGKYIGFLNSDDIYTENALLLLNKYITKFPDKDFIFGSVRKHWAVLYGFRPYKIYWSWGFYSSHSTGFFIKRDSAKKVGLYNLKYKYGMNPLCLTVTPALPLELGEQNLRAFVESGFNHISINPAYEAMRVLNKRGLIEKGFPYFGWLTAIHTIPIRMAAHLGIDLIFYGEDGEV